ncbi:hypothetical protein AB0L53_29465 [Nonomuraea sp. NPDC052129]|uniref:hypothetical protein n=1 Tax=Nonomuraea sp. NPDC052129 TaxID=3154651 RepID=UPI00342B9A09
MTSVWIDENAPALTGLGFNVEYDALPGLSQRAGVVEHEPVTFEGDAYAPSYGPGHGCGHNALAAASVGAAIAAARILHDRATIKVFASTGEEQLVGKAYAVREGAYDGLDAFLDWHPAPVTGTGWDVTSALYSATFSFLGSPGHGSNPLGTRSGLDGVLLLTGMIERLRAGNVAPSGRISYAIGGGGAPNVTPDLQTLWVYVRESTHERARTLYDKVVACATAAATASQTRLEHRLVTAIRESRSACRCTRGRPRPRPAPRSPTPGCWPPPATWPRRPSRWSSSPRRWRRSARSSPPVNGGATRCPPGRSLRTTCRHPRSSKRQGSRRARSGRRPSPPNS